MSRQNSVPNTHLTSAHVPLAAMAGRNIICFAKDWNEDPTSCNHVLTGLAKNNQILWLNSISTRAPRLSSGRDLKKIGRKLAGFLKGPQQVGSQMWVYTPLVLPQHNHPNAVALNQWILRITLALLRHRLKMKSFQLWSFVPTAAPYIDRLGADMTVFYCVDEWSAFRLSDSETMAAMTQSIAAQCDVVFATSRPLVEKLSQFNKHTHLASHGVDYTLFATALNAATDVPADLAALPGPVLGFYGLIEDWLDQELLAYIAERHPEWSIALVGSTRVDTSRLEAFPNIHFLGRKPHDQLPAYCKGFDVALIPHKVNDLTRNMNPIKLREYLSAGLPIVATALPELKNYPEHCTISDSYDAFIQAVEAILQQEKDAPQLRPERSFSMRSETWEAKLAILSTTLLKVYSEKCTTRKKKQAQHRSVSA